jgi:LAO/AO transport system kinase
VTDRELARLATLVENGASLSSLGINAAEGEGLIIGVTGPPGVGKSTLVDALTAELRRREKKIAIVAVDPSSRATRGAILGDRVRMQRHHADPGVFIRSMATRGATGGLARTSAALARLFRSAGFDYIAIETVGTGQDEIDVAALADVTMVVLIPGMGDDVQAIKAGIMEIADVFVINKSDRPGAAETQREIESMLSLTPGAARPPVFKTIATDGTGISELAEELEKRKRKIHETAAETWSIDHLGIAVHSIADALPFYESQIGLPVLSRETVPHEKVHVAMLPAGGSSRIELLEPMEPGSTIAKFIEKRGPGLHHVAMRVPDLNATVKRLTDAGVRLLGAPQRGAGGHLYAFVHPSSTGGVLWELIQES